MSPHTKGPWNVWGVGEVVSKEFGGTLCDCYGPDDVAEANAQLISAAPDLLEALETYHRRMTAALPYAQFTTEMHQADLAIRKARGET